MSKIFSNLLFLKGDTNLIFLAGSKALVLSEGGCLPKPAIFNSCLRTAASFSASKSAFSCSAFLSHAFLAPLLILIHAIRQLPLTQPVLTLELAQVVHPVTLSRHCELFELLHELPHVLIAVLHAQNFCSFRS